MTQLNSIISGAGSGIGQGVSLSLNEQGWHLAITDINEQALLELSHNWDKNTFSLYTMNVADESRVKTVIDDYCQQHGQTLRLLFNCAGVLEIGDFEEIALARHHAIVDINIKGMINTCHHGFLYLRNTKNAQVINMSSASATYGIPKLSTYSASKFAVKGFTEALELEWLEYDISVSDIMPPFVATNMLSSQTHSAAILKRLGVNLKSADVTKSILKQIKQPKLHRPVSLQFSLLYYLNALSPTWINRVIIKWLSR
jgi:NADP-dependent 3-hydroxy acid dehydrogenase YdfG